MGGHHDPDAPSSLTLRFTDPALERAFRESDLARSRGWLRYGFLTSIALWILLPIPFSMVMPDNTVLFGTAASMCVWLALLERASLRTSRYSTLQWLGFAGNVAAGLAVIAISSAEGVMASWGPPLIMLVMIFSFFLLGLRLVFAFASALAYAPVFLVSYALESSAAETIVTVGLILPMLAILVAATYALERGRRRSWLLRRIVEDQAETILRERARTEALLQQEVRHQVAARSRELGQMLAKIDASFVIGPLSTGDVFADRYRIMRTLGAGGMGAVYEVERRTDERRLALKIVTGVVSGAQAARFAREAEIGARVEHPHVVPIFDVGISQGAPFLVMELAASGSLEDRRCRFGDSEWALRVLRQIAKGLEALHEAAVVHRDLKPANVLVCRREGGVEVAKISDFGISRLGQDDGGDAGVPDIDPHAATLAAAAPARCPELTATGMLLGTPFYMAPETVLGGESIGPPADVFSFGILGCEMLTGDGPFDVPPMLRVLAGEPIHPPRIVHVDAALQDLLSSCLHQDPERRPTMQRVCEVLGEPSSSLG